MKLASKFTLLFVLYINLGMGLVVNAASWPTESLLTIQNNNYGRLCTTCTNVFSKGYCAPTCCNSCQAEADKLSLNFPSACNAVCEMEQTPTSADLNAEKKCKDSNYTLPNCENLKKYIADEKSADLNYDYNKRVESCNEAVVETQANCQEAKLDQAYPQDLFNLAKEIVESPSCDFSKVESYNLRTQQVKPDEVINSCVSKFNECKKFCNDMNAIYSEINGRVVSRTNNVGQAEYENKCQPVFARFKDKKAIREEFILEANNTVLSCKSSEDGGSEDVVGDSDYDGVSDDPVATAETATTDPNPNLAVNNPEVAMNNINGLISAFQPFIPVNQGNYNPGLYNSTTGSAIPAGQRYGLSESEMYGADYSGWDAKDTDGLEYLDTKAFDRPASLKPQNNKNRDSNDGNMGGSFGALGGSSGGSNKGGSNKSGPRGAAQKKSKDKTLFGKATGGSNSYSSSSPGSKKGAKNSFGTSFGGSGGKSSLYNSERKFDATKYHQAIMSSYQKGLKSKAQLRAERRAAGLSSESLDEKVMRGYTMWHQDNKIHPDTISLFMQAKICYHTKFSSNFKSTCEFSKP